MHVKPWIAFGHLSVQQPEFGLLVKDLTQGCWKFHCRRGFDFWQFTAQAEKWSWARNCKFYNFLIFLKMKF